MRTAAICPTCATYTNAVCVLYDGPYLSTLEINPLTDLEEVIQVIDAKINDIQPPLQTKVSLSSAQILTLGSSPVTLVPAQGAGKVIIPISVVLNYNFVTSAYSTVTNLFIASPSSPTSITRNGVLGFVSDACTFDAPINSGASNALTGNEALIITTTGGNPTGGDSTLDVYVTYVIITI